MYPREWLERVPAAVFACLIPGELRILLLPDGSAAPRDIPMEMVPSELRLPNAPIWVQLDDEMNVLRVWRRQV